MLKTRRWIEGNSIHINAFVVELTITEKTHVGLLNTEKCKSYLYQISNLEMSGAGAAVKIYERNKEISGICLFLVG